MKKTALSVLLLAAAIAAIFGANTASGDPDTGTSAAIENMPSITPDSLFWGIKDELESISLALTFDPAERAKKGLSIAEERLIEFRIMAEEGKIGAAQKAKDSHDRYIEKIKTAAGSIRNDNKTKEIEEQAEIEKEAEDLEDLAEKTGTQIKIKIEASGSLTAEQKSLIESLIASMQNKTGSLKIKIKNETEDNEDEHNLTSSKERKANETISDAKEEIAKLDEDIAKYNVTDTAIIALRNNAEAKLAEAESALSASKFGEAYGLANAAEQLAENAREKIEKLVKNEEKEHENERNKTKEKEGDGIIICAQVITPATNEKTGECKEFLTPCDVLDGWEKVESCPSASAAGTEEKSVWIEEAFDLFTETRNNEKMCKARNITIAPRECVLQNITYDSRYLTRLENKALETGGCIEKVVHRFLAIRKGETEIRTFGTCDNYSKVYEIKIKG